MNSTLRILLLSFSCPLFFYTAAAQSKADKKAVKQLKTDIGYLSSDDLEGRRTGSAGERKAGDYIIQAYEQAKIPAFRGQYRYTFHFTYGREIAAATAIRLNGSLLPYGNEVFPLPFSASKAVTADVLQDVPEQGNMWLIPLYRSEEEANDPHFDWEKYTYDKSKEAVQQGATGVMFYDGYGSKYPPVYNVRSEYETLDIPVVYTGFAPFKTYILPSKGSVQADVNVALQKPDRTGSNIAAYIDNKALYTVVLGAHYDHLGYGEDGSSLYAGKDKKIHHGADDNASGTAALIQLAQWIKKGRLKKYNYLFVHFSGEELGLLGSKAFIKEQGIDSARTAYMINMDMVGRLNDSTHALTVGGVGTSPVWGNVISKDDETFHISVDSSGVGPSDHTSFYYAGIPVLFFFTGTHSDYHKPSDVADKINYTGEVEVMHYIYRVVQKISDGSKPAFTATKQSSVGKVRLKVTLGIMPDYAYQEGGVRIDGISEGKTADKAGLKAGDIIIQLGDTKVNGMQSYMEALAKFKEGDKTKVTVKRGSKEITLPVHFR